MALTFALIERALPADMVAVVAKMVHGLGWIHVLSEAMEATRRRSARARASLARKVQDAYQKFFPNSVYDVGASVNEGIVGSLRREIAYFDASARGGDDSEGACAARAVAWTEADDDMFDVFADLPPLLEEPET